MAQVWGIGERKFGGDFDRRMMMSWSKAYSYTESKYRDGKDGRRSILEALQERYIRWILDRCRLHN